MSTRIFFLDDDPVRTRRFKMNRVGMDITTAQNYESACATLAGTVFDVAHLDHDLSDLAAAGTPAADEKTGTHVAEFIVSLPPEKRPRLVVLHSYNNAGRRRMAAILLAAGVQCVTEPFCD
jgi:ActR/RegA family two-component response regulator